MNPRARLAPRSGAAGAAGARDARRVGALATAALALALASCRGLLGGEREGQRAPTLAARSVELGAVAQRLASALLDSTRLADEVASRGAADARIVVLLGELRDEDGRALALPEVRESLRTAFLSTGRVRLAGPTGGASEPASADAARAAELGADVLVRGTLRTEERRPSAPGRLKQLERRLELEALSVASGERLAAEVAELVPVEG